MDSGASLEAQNGEPQEPQQRLNRERRGKGVSRPVPRNKRLPPLQLSSPPASTPRSECADKAESCRRHGSINTENKGFALPILIQSACETCFGVQTYNQDEKHTSICQKCSRHFPSARERIKKGTILLNHTHSFLTVSWYFATRENPFFNISNYTEIFVEFITGKHRCWE